MNYPQWERQQNEREKSALNGCASVLITAGALVAAAVITYYFFQ
jgi:hypothetical protein